MDTKEKFIDILFPIICREINSLKRNEESDEHRAAYHEAGHAYMAHEEEFCIKSVSIKPQKAPFGGRFLGKTDVDAPPKTGNVEGFTRYVYSGCISQQYHFGTVTKDNLKWEVDIFFDKKHRFYSEKDFDLLKDIFRATVPDIISKEALDEIKRIAEYLLEWGDCGGPEIEKFLFPE